LPAAFAYLNIPVMFPAGTTGDTMTMTATASTTTPERSLANNSSQMTFTYITPQPADVTITGMDAYPPQVVAGDQVTLYIAVDNIGGSPADNVTVRLPLADTVEPVSADGGRDADSGQASTTYPTQGFISGRVWLDQDRDGQRDPDEPGVENGGDGVRSLLLMREGLIYPAWDTPVAFVGHDGTYTQPLAPGRYFVRVNVSLALDYTTPNNGDEATDSDVVFTARAWDEVTAESAVVDVIDGQHTVIDIGLVPAQP